MDCPPRKMAVVKRLKQNLVYGPAAKKKMAGVEKWPLYCGGSIVFRNSSECLIIQINRTLLHNSVKPHINKQGKTK